MTAQPGATDPPTRYALRVKPGNPYAGDLITVRRDTTRQQIQWFRDQLTIAEQLEIITLDTEGNPTP